MPLAIDISSTVRRLLISKERVRQAAATTLKAERIADAMLSVTFVGRAAITAMNRRYLGHHGATDVISFGFDSQGARSAVIGDIYICPEVARENAKRQGVSASEEIMRLVVHGTLHVLGYEHPDTPARTKSKMWQRQERILARLL